MRTAASMKSLLPPGEGQDEGAFHSHFPLTLSLREREHNIAHYLPVGSVAPFDTEAAVAAASAMLDIRR